MHFAFELMFVQMQQKVLVMLLIQPEPGKNETK